MAVGQPRAKQWELFQFGQLTPIPQRGNEGDECLNHWISGPYEVARLHR